MQRGKRIGTGLGTRGEKTAEGKEKRAAKMEESGIIK